MAGLPTDEQRLREMANNPAVADHLRLRALRELGRRRMLDAQSPSRTEPHMLSDEERELVADALHWRFDQSLWTPEQRELCLRLGLTTQHELDAADALKRLGVQESQDRLAASER